MLKELRIHKLKTLQPFYDEVLIGKKTFEVRKNDRDFKIGDIINLEEWTGTEYTGEGMALELTYILKGGQYGIDKDYCVLGIEHLQF